MAPSASDTALAYTYAWWLTGDDERARAAVRSATADLEHLDPGQRRLALLARVRATAITERTMCPASELALLHDGHGIALEHAASLAEIDPADARTELAHGRLEALLETVEEPFEHPERLGGLAVGNPPDVAHARQCTSCAAAERLLARGREELREIPAPPLPDSFETAAAARAPLVFDDLRTDEPPIVIEPDLGPALASPEPGGRRWLLPAVIALALLLLAVTVVAAVLPGSGDPDPGRSTTAPPAGTGDPNPNGTDMTGDTNADEPLPDGLDASPDPAPDGPFAVEATGLVRDGAFVPAGPGIVLEPSERVRIAARYRGAGGGVTVLGHWTVDGEPFRDLRVALTSARSAHVFGAPVPAGGWPSGLHHVVLTVDGAVVATVDFRVA